MENLLKPLTPMERELLDKRETKMYGMTKEAMLKDLAMQAFGNPLMLSMQILSDAQHVMEQGDIETARQFINKSKWVISKCMEQAIEQKIVFTLTDKE